MSISDEIGEGVRTTEFGRGRGVLAWRSVRLRTDRLQKGIQPLLVFRLTAVRLQEKRPVL